MSNINIYEVERDEYSNFSEYKKELLIRSLITQLVKDASEGNYEVFANVLDEIPEERLLGWMPEEYSEKLEHIIWVETDPDNYQFGRQIGEGIYEFKEFGVPDLVATLDEAIGDSENWTQETIDLSKFSDELKESVASSYYGSLDELKEQCGDSWEWILAECIFEHEYMSY